MRTPLALPRFRALPLGLCAAITLLLAGFGVYGVTAADVRQRTREIGIRTACGAEPRALNASSLRRGVLLGVAGCAVGAAGATIGTRILGTLLFGVEATGAVGNIIFGRRLGAGRSQVCLFGGKRRMWADFVSGWTHPETGEPGEDLARVDRI